MKTLIKKLKALRLYFVRKRCFEVYYTDRNNKEGRIKVWVHNVDEVDDYFAKKYPHLELYDIGEC